jgi:tRNA(Leu) C34 or U34 (ribose-2'-O)-methylase TrmL
MKAFAASVSMTLFKGSSCTGTQTNLNQPDGQCFQFGPSDDGLNISSITPGCSRKLALPLMNEDQSFELTKAFELMKW